MAAIKISSGLHGVGVSVVNALSEWCQVDVKRDGILYRQRYEQGVAVTPLLEVDLVEEDDTGTITSFIPDLAVMETRDYNFDVLAQRFREMAYLNRGVTISLRDERTDREVTFYFEGGLVYFVRYLNKGRGRLMARPVSTVRELDDVKVELAVQYNDSWNPPSSPLPTVSTRLMAACTSQASAARSHARSTTMRVR